MGKTIAALLAEGQALLAKREQEKQERQRKAEQVRQELWASVRAFAVEDLGEMADSLPSMTPEEFKAEGDGGHHILKIRPFGGAWIMTTYTHDVGKWVPVRFENRGRFVVPAKYRFDAKLDVPEPDEIIYTDSLAEAVVIAHQAQESWLSVAERIASCDPDDVPF